MILRFRVYLDPPSTLKSGLGTFYLGIPRVYRGYLGGLGRVQGLGMGLGNPSALFF